MFILCSPTARRYGKHCHGREFRDEFSRKKEQRATRCFAIDDCGRTRGAQQGAPYFCLHFARGACAQGANCSFLHLIRSRGAQPVMRRYASARSRLVAARCPARCPPSQVPRQGRPQRPASLPRQASAGP